MHTKLRTKIFFLIGFLIIQVLYKNYLTPENE